jgi:hypothetical protein
MLWARRLHEESSVPALDVGWCLASGPHFPAIISDDPCNPSANMEIAIISRSYPSLHARQNTLGPLPNNYLQDSIVSIPSQRYTQFYGYIDECSSLLRRSLASTLRCRMAINNHAHVRLKFDSALKSRTTWKVPAFWRRLNHVKFLGRSSLMMHLVLDRVPSAFRGLGPQCAGTTRTNCQINCGDDR